jgi:hypothetical protein
MRPEADVSLAAWWAEGDDPWDLLCTIGPRGYASYAQVLVPLDDTAAARVPAGPGNHDDRTLGAVLDGLAGHTATPDDCCWCLWDGWGPLPVGPRVSLVHREYALFRGPLGEGWRWPVGVTDVAAPAAVWPADRAWFVAFDVDPCWLGVGASSDAVRALLADPRLDARAVAWGALEDPRGVVA